MTDKDYFAKDDEYEENDGEGDAEVLN